MATKIYDSENIILLNGEEIYLTPLKIKYLREFLAEFETLKSAKTDQEAVDVLVRCATISMKQYCPSIKTTDDLEDAVDIPTIYKILDIAAGIKIDSNKEDKPVKDQASESGSSWDDLDLAKLESEIFLLGIWKDYEDLETSLSMPELTISLEAKRDADYQHKKFLAALKGIDLDEQNGVKEEDPWEAMKARVYSKGQTSNPNDILALQGDNAAKAGFGIGMGLSYERID